MASKVVLVDDFDGSAQAYRFTFAIGDMTYEIDLTDQNAAVFQSALAPYVAAARALGAETTRRSGTCTKAEPKAVRSWAIERGFAIGDRGRIPSQLVDRYLEAQAVDRKS